MIHSFQLIVLLVLLPHVHTTQTIDFIVKLFLYQLHVLHYFYTMSIPYMLQYVFNLDCPLSERVSLTSTPLRQNPPQRQGNDVTPVRYKCLNIYRTLRQWNLSTVIS